MKKKIGIVIVTIAIALLGGITYAKSRMAPKEEVVSQETLIQAQPLEKHDLSSVINATGKVESQNVVVVTTEITSKVKTLNVSLGDYVEKGQVLCTFDDTEIKEQIEEMKSQDPTLKAYGDQIEYRNPKGNYVSDESFNETSATYKELVKLYKKLDSTIVKADQAGIITSLNVSKGSIPSGTLMQIEDDKQLKVNVIIKEKDITKIQKGMKATVTSDALEGEEVNGSVTRVINFATSSVENGSTSSNDKGTNYSAEISLDTENHFLLGMSAKVVIKLSDEDALLSCPYDSVAMDEDGKSYVYRATSTKKEGIYKVEKVYVEQGQAGDYYTAISSDSLKEGDLIINTPYSVSEGDEVELSIADGATIKEE